MELRIVVFVFDLTGIVEITIGGAHGFEKLKHISAAARAQPEGGDDEQDELDNEVDAPEICPLVFGEMVVVTEEHAGDEGEE